MKTGKNIKSEWCKQIYSDQYLSFPKKQEFESWCSYFFPKSEAGHVLKMFLNFQEISGWCSYKLGSYKKKVYHVSLTTTRTYWYQRPGDGGSKGNKFIRKLFFQILILIYLFQYQQGMSWFFMISNKTEWLIKRPLDDERMDGCANGSPGRMDRHKLFLEIGIMHG